MSLINQERASRNLATLSLHPLLSQVAKDYSREMMEHGFLSHISQVDGSTLWDRIRRSGYYDDYHGQIVILENIALISGPAKATAAHEGFMNSDGHRENLLSSDVNEVGFGITEGIFRSVFSAIYVEVFAYHARTQQITLSTNVSPTAATVQLGETARFRIHVESSISISISIDVANLRPPLVWTLDRSTGITPLDATLTVNTSSATVGVYSFSIVVTGGGQTKVTSLVLNVVRPVQVTTSQTTSAFTSTYTSSTLTIITTGSSVTQVVTVTTITKETQNTTRTTNLATSSQTTTSSWSLSEATSTSFQTTTHSTSHQTAQTVGTSSSQAIKIPIPSLRCVIATAAFGSDLSPEVQLLRQFRDVTVMSTFSGRMFMTAFNVAYYSVSPNIASFVARHEWAASMVRTIAHPMISVLRLAVLILSSLPVDGEVAILLYGVLVACLIGLTYLSPLVILIVAGRSSKCRAGFHAVQASLSQVRL